MKSQRVNLIASGRGYGTAKDLDVVAEAFAGSRLRVTQSAMGRVSRLEKVRRRVLSAIPGIYPYQANIFLQIAAPRVFPWAMCNWLVPNQEWMLNNPTVYLEQFDCVLCKTMHATELFSERGYPTSFIGFTSPDVGGREAGYDQARVLHLAGGSIAKGTEEVIRVWARHPEWPVLTLVSREPRPAAEGVSNIDLRIGVFSDDEIRHLQRSHGVHLCPSHMEGFGHYINEAMSCGAVVVTTDAPPMHELVQPDRGVLVGVKGSEPHTFGTRFFPDEDALEAAVERVLGMSTEEKAAIGARARAWYEANDRAFRERFMRVFSELSGLDLPKRPGSAA